MHQNEVNRIIFMPKNFQKSLLVKVQKEIEQNKLIAPGDFVYVALSGGADSVCLFDILFKLQDKLNFKLAACHFNHKMRGEESLRDQKFVEEICAKRGIELKVGQWQGKNSLKSELKAREARYAFFEQILGSSRGVKVALAHNANDNLETFLMRLIRGTGLSGLRSIPLQRKNFLRPLLPFSRREILDYLKTHQIGFVEDLSNENLDYFRNKIRLKVIPQLLEYNPNLIATMSDNIEVLSEDFDFLAASAEKKYQKIAHYTKNRVTILRSDWLKLHPALRYEVLRLACQKLGVSLDISVLHLKNIYQLIEKGVGKKKVPLPHSLLCELINGKIIVSRKPHKMW